jgi:hypothetical protein
MYRGDMTNPAPDPLSVAAASVGDVEMWIRTRRAYGASWEVLAARLNEITGTAAPPISREYLRRRFKHIDRFTAPPTPAATP